MSHRKLAMKKLTLAASILVTFLILSSVTGVSAAAERIASKFADRVVFLVHVAQLYTKDPDKKLAMPLKDVSKKQVANHRQCRRHATASSLRRLRAGAWCDEPFAAA